MTAPGYAPASALMAGDEIEGEDEETGLATRLSVVGVTEVVTMLEIVTSDGKRNMVGRDDIVLILAPEVGS